MTVEWERSYTTSMPYYSCEIAGKKVSVYLPDRRGPWCWCSHGHGIGAYTALNAVSATDAQDEAIKLLRVRAQGILDATAPATPGEG